MTSARCTSSLENRVSVIENKLSSVISQNLNSEELVVSEVLDRLFRSNNLIIFNISGHINNTLIDDTAFVNSLFYSLSRNISFRSIT